jgi:hypothetical protein
MFFKDINDHHQKTKANSNEIVIFKLNFKF